MNFNANSIIRLLLSVLDTWPPDPWSIAAPGALNTAWLAMLKNSARNWRSLDSVTGTSFSNEKSSSARLSARGTNPTRADQVYAQALRLQSLIDEVVEVVTLQEQVKT